MVKIAEAEIVAFTSFVSMGVFLKNTSRYFARLSETCHSCCTFN